MNTWYNEYHLSPFAPENLVSRDEFGSPVPRQPAHRHTQVVFSTLTDLASTRPSNIRGCQSGTWSQRGTKVNGSHHGHNPLLRPAGIQIATKSYATLQAMAPTNIKTVHQPLLHIESSLRYCCLYYRITTNEYRLVCTGRFDIKILFVCTRVHSLLLYAQRSLLLCREVLRIYEQLHQLGSPRSTSPGLNTAVLQLR